MVVLLLVVGVLFVEDFFGVLIFMVLVGCSLMVCVCILFGGWLVNILLLLVLVYW